MMKWRNKAEADNIYIRFFPASVRGLLLVIKQPKYSHTQHKLQKATTKKLSSIVQELCESRGGRPGLFVLMSLLVSVDVKIY